MTNPLEIIIDDARAQRWFGGLLARGSDITGLMEEISENLTRTAQDRFKTSTGPDGVAWAALKDGSGRRPLLKTGTMRDQIYPSHGANWAQVTATAKQARWHQQGTKPYVIKPKNGKALAFKGRDGKPAFTKKVNHPGLPPRPFIGLSDADVQLIDGLAVAWLNLDAE